MNTNPLRSALEALVAKLKARSVVVENDFVEGIITERDDIIKRLDVILSAYPEAKPEAGLREALETFSRAWEHDVLEDQSRNPELYPMLRRAGLIAISILHPERVRQADRAIVDESAKRAALLHSAPGELLPTGIEDRSSEITFSDDEPAVQIKYRCHNGHEWSTGTNYCAECGYLGVEVISDAPASAVAPPADFATSTEGTVPKSVFQGAVEEAGSVLPVLNTWYAGDLDGNDRVIFASDYDRLRLATAPTPQAAEEPGKDEKRWKPKDGRCVCDWDSDKITWLNPSCPVHLQDAPTQYRDMVIEQEGK